MENIIAQIVGISVIVGLLMEIVIKPFLKELLPELNSKWANSPGMEEFDLSYTFKGLAIALGIGLTIIFFPEVSFFDAFEFSLKNQYLDISIVDSIVVGALAGMGEKKTHDVVDFCKQLAALFSQIKGK